MTVTLLAALAVMAGVLLHKTASLVIPQCSASGPAGVFTLSLEQGANATTIAAVARRDGLPNHAVTIALAAALQESKLRDLSSGDLDSVGLFQQRPSQGWGRAADLIVPRLATEAFFRALVKVPGWTTLAVTEAAQSVQHSAAPGAYAQWETEARTLAQGLTGETPATFACHFPAPKRQTASEPLVTALEADNGTGAVGPAVTPARGWVVASWLVGHAAPYRIVTVAFGGQRWTSATGRWVADPAAGSSVSLLRSGVAPGAELAAP